MLLVSVCVLALAAAPPAAAQGCTLGLPVAIENAIDDLLLGACDRHDDCWRTRNPCGGPYLGTDWKAACDLDFLADLTAVCAAATTIFSFPNPSFASAADFLEDCEAGAAAAYAGVSVSFHLWNGTQCLNGCNLDACNAIGAQLPWHCCLELPVCECWSDQDCSHLGDPGWGTWQCIGCECMLTNSPLALHLPDYSSTAHEARSWWREGFCGSEGPTLCLDWRGDGDVTCTAWTSPGSDVAFVVRLSAGDLSRLAAGLAVRAQPWRHFFGNVSKGPAGDFPFANGFEALAAHCGQGAEDGSEIDLAACGSSLFAWADRSADGELDPGELVALPDLGVEALGDLRRSGKQDRCGNTFPAESHALCAGRPGPCGTWLDVFFASRPPAVP
ncbi:MAG TPA: hypothetical protein VHM02_06455 [Thermoanaerobaculia bacterium]|nr:hypothetical protein [Thermoanaerobaculia bacterium]